MLFSKNKIIITTVAAVIIVGILTLFAGISDAPKKSMAEIEKAVKNRDLETFEKYVNLQNFFSKGFDSYLTAHKGEEAGAMSAADAGFLSMFKSAIVEELITSAKQTVKKGETLSQSAVGNMGGIAEEFGIASWNLKHVGSSKKRGKAAIVPVTIHDQQVDKDFVFEIELRKTDDSIWRVQEVANADDLIVARILAAKEKLDKINAVIMKELAEVIEVSNEKNGLEINESGYFSSRYAKTSFSAKNRQNKSIASFGAKITIYDVNGETLLSHTDSWSDSKAGLLGTGKQGAFSTKKYLSQQEYDRLSKKENQGGKTIIEVTYIKFNDGTELRELSKLSPYEKQ